MRNGVKPLVGVLTLAVWALAAGSALYWGLRLRAGTEGQIGVAVTPAPAPPAVDVAAVARALGAVAPSAAAPAQVAAAGPALLTRLQLRGVVTRGAAGAALIAIDGKPPKPYAVGAVLEGDWTVRSVTPHAVLIGAGGAQTATLQMPPMNERSRAGDAVASSTAGMAPQPVPPTQPQPQPQPQAYLPSANRPGTSLPGVLTSPMAPSAAGGG